MPDVDLLKFAGFTLDLAGHALRDADGHDVALTPAEFALLDTFVRNPGRVLTRDQLLVEVAGRDSESYDRSVDVLVGRLRRKIERNPKEPELIVTLPRVGYKFTARPQVVTPASVVSEAAGEPVTRGVDEAAAHRGDSRPAPSPMERRQVTIMSCEFVGLAGLSARLDPEDLGAVVASRQRCWADVIARFGGAIAKLTGDGMLAYFGYPQAHEHDAERAVRAGLAATAALAKLHDGPTAGIALRTGIATGAVVVGDLAGDGGAEDSAVIGEPFTLAVHLRSRAPVGGVLIAPGTRRLVGGLFAYRELAPVQLEGFAAPVAAWQITGERSAESRFSALRDAGAASFVGRADEIELLSRCWNEAKSGEGRVVVITGEPGVGKSRLCAALAEPVVAESHATSSWQCSPHHPDSTLHPVISQLERAAGFEREDTTEQKAARLATLLRASNPDETALLSGLLGLPIPDHAPEPSPQRRKQMTLEALLSRLAGAAPTLMLFEDAHWADPTSLEFLTLLVDRVQHLPVLLLITARPEFAPPWAAESHIAAVTLNRLSRRDAAALVLQVAGGKRLPDPVLEDILLRTDRVPLFVEELTKAVIEAGSLIEMVDHYVLSGPPPQSTIPTTLQDALTAWLDRLAHGKEAAQIGAAIGREFSHATLLASLAGDAREIAQALDELVRSELAFRRGVPPDAVYTFKHALVRDAAYNSMSRAKRQACHARIATALVRGEPDIAATQPELLAYHHQEAGKHEAALTFWPQAGDLAARRAAAREAASHYRSAIALLPYVADKQKRLQFEFELCMKLANALMQFEALNSTTVTDIFARAYVISLELGQTEEYLDACIAGVTGLFVQSRYTEGLAILAKVDAGQLVPAGPARIHLDFLKGAGNYRQGNFDEAWRMIVQAIARDDAEPRTAARPIFGGDPAMIMRTYGNLLRICQGYLEQAAALAEQAVRICELRNHAFSLAMAKCAQARSELVRGRYAEAEDIATQTIDLCRRHGFAAREPYCLLWRGIARLALGDTKGGVPEIRECVTRWISAGGDPVTPAVQAAQFLIGAGLYSDGAEFLGIVERVERDSEDRVVAAEVLRLRGNLLAADGRPRDAEAKLRQALAVAQQQGARLFALRAATDLAGLLHEGGNAAEVAALLRPLYGSFTEGFDAPDLKRAAAVLAAVTSMA
jgi:class 3 adenylate cyclase/tetratricopeptide (TPR) repeat protein